MSEAHWGTYEEDAECVLLSTKVAWEGAAYGYAYVESGIVPTNGDGS